MTILHWLVVSYLGEVKTLENYDDLSQNVIIFKYEIVIVLATRLTKLFLGDYDQFRLS
jgi:hypothetical protein